MHVGGEMHAREKGERNGTDQEVDGERRRRREWRTRRGRKMSANKLRTLKSGSPHRPKQVVRQNGNEPDDSIPHHDCWSHQRKRGTETASGNGTGTRIFLYRKDMSNHMKISERRREKENISKSAINKIVSYENKICGEQKTEEVAKENGRKCIFECSSKHTSGAKAEKIIW